MKTKEQALALLASWARSFGAAVLTLYIAGETRPSTLLGAGGAACAPVILRWLNPNDTAFGRSK